MGYARDMGTYHLAEQRRLRRACALSLSRQNLRFSRTQIVTEYVFVLFDSIRPSQHFFQLC